MGITSPPLGILRELPREIAAPILLNRCGGCKRIAHAIPAQRPEPGQGLRHRTCRCRSPCPARSKRVIWFMTILPSASYILHALRRGALAQRGFEGAAPSGPRGDSERNAMKATYGSVRMECSESGMRSGADLWEGPNGAMKRASSCSFRRAGWPLCG